MRGPRAGGWEPRLKAKGAFHSPAGRNPRLSRVRAVWKGRRRNAKSRQSKYHHMCIPRKNRNVNRALSKINTCKINTEGQYIKQK